MGVKEMEEFMLRWAYRDPNVPKAINYFSEMVGMSPVEISAYIRKNPGRLRIELIENYVALEPAHAEALGQAAKEILRRIRRRNGLVPDPLTLQQRQNHIDLILLGRPSGHFFVKPARKKNSDEQWAPYDVARNKGGAVSRRINKGG